MKYSDLLEVLRDMTPEQLQDHITICDRDGLMWQGEILTADGDDILHDGHLFLSTLEVGEWDRKGFWEDLDA
jgi:hypothetical protein